MALTRFPSVQPLPSLAMLGRGLVFALALAMPVAAASVADFVRPAPALLDR
jgi:hypothetical protein